jgi:hypothetical protein
MEGDWKDALCVGRFARRARGEYELSSGAEEVRDVGAGEELCAGRSRTRGAGCAGLAAWVVRDARLISLQRRQDDDAVVGHRY